MTTLEDILAGSLDITDIQGCQRDAGRLCELWLCEHADEVRRILRWLPCTSDADLVDTLLTEGLNTLSTLADMEKRLAEADDLKV